MRSNFGFGWQQSIATIPNIVKRDLWCRLRDIQPTVGSDVALIKYFDTTCIKNTISRRFMKKL